jgi:hypothetical protein
LAGVRVWPISSIRGAAPSRQQSGIETGRIAEIPKTTFMTQTGRDASIVRLSKSMEYWYGLSDQKRHVLAGYGRACDSLATLAPLFFLCRLRGLFLFGASGSGAPLMDAFFSATLSRPPLERVLVWVVRATGTLIGCHGRNIRSIFRGRYLDRW